MEVMLQVHSALMEVKEIPICWQVNGGFHKVLKALDTTGNCQRPVFSLGVSQHKHKITNLWKVELNWPLSKLRDNNKRKTPSSLEVAFFQMLDFDTSKSNSGIKFKFVEYYFSFENYVTSEGAVFSQCFILSTCPHYSLPIKVLC